MSTDEIKGRIYEAIENIDDDEFLLTIQELIERKYQSQVAPKLKDFQFQRIKESEKQILKGEFLNDEQVDEIIDKWLKE